MCNACGFLCCGYDGFSGCGCDHCECPDCWSEGDDFFCEEVDDVEDGFDAGEWNNPPAEAPSQPQENSRG